MVEGSQVPSRPALMSSSCAQSRGRAALTGSHRGGPTQPRPHPAVPPAQLARDFDIPNRRVSIERVWSNQCEGQRSSGSRATLFPARRRAGC